MKKAADILALVCKVIVVILAVSLVADVTIQILGRYIFLHPFPWTEEMARFLMIWIVTFAAPLAARGDRFVRVDILTNRLPDGIREKYLAVLNFLISSFLLFVAWKAVGLIRVGSMQRSPVLRIPMSHMYLSMFLCPALCAFFFILNGIGAFTAGSSGAISADDPAAAAGKGGSR